MTKKKPVTKKPVTKTEKATRSAYTEAKGEKICQWIASGKTLRDFCRKYDSFDTRTVQGWKRNVDEFGIAYAQARLDGTEVLAEELLAIADEEDVGETVILDTETLFHGGKKTEKRKERIARGDRVEHRKLRIQTRQWLLERWNPAYRSQSRKPDEDTGEGQVKVTGGLPDD